MAVASRHLCIAPDADPAVESPSSDADARDTFVFEVTAREPDGVGNATIESRRIDPPMEPASRNELQSVARMLQEALAQATHRTLVDDVVSTPANHTAEGETASGTLPLEMPALGNDLPGKRDVSPRRSGWPACYLSLVVHGTALLAMGLMTVALPRQLEDLNLSLAADPLEEVEFSNIDETTENEGGEGVEQLEAGESGGLLETGEEALGGDVGEMALGDLADDALLAGALGEVSNGSGDGSLDDIGLLFGAGSGGGQGGGRGNGGGGARSRVTDELGPAPLAKFFGTKIEGRRIVFVLDNSGSMQGGRLETVIDELNRCVDSLSPEQEFYVIFYSDTIYPLSYPEAVDRYVPATEQNKKVLANWLDTVELCVGDAVIEALSAAATIEPDVVLLLSDGRVQGEKKLGFLLDARSRDFPIHTVGIGLGSGVASRRNLQEIALANGGDFREAEVPTPMRELARKQPRPYHSTSPGFIWGRQVRARRLAR